MIQYYCDRCKQGPLAVSEIKTVLIGAQHDLCVGCFYVISGVLAAPPAIPFTPEAPVTEPNS